MIDKIIEYLKDETQSLRGFGTCDRDLMEMIGYLENQKQQITKQAEVISEQYDSCAKQAEQLKKCQEIAMALGIEHNEKNAVIDRQAEQIKEAEKVLNFYASHETQYSSDDDLPAVRDDDGFAIDDFNYIQGSYKQFGKRAREYLVKYKTK